MPQYEDVYEPPILDATAQAIANAILGLNPPIPSFISDAFSVERSYSTGDIVIYENKVYVFTSNKSAGAWDSTKVTETTIGAICTATNASLMKCQEVQFTITGTAITGVGQYATILNRFDLKTSTAVDSVFTNKQLKDIFGGHTIKGVVGLYTNGATIPKETIVWPDDETLTMSALSFVASTQTVTSVRLLVFYI